MSKLLWVALPLLLVVALLAGLAVARRLGNPRLTINIWSSLLLVLYVGTTAGLGIFWVANQQLPAFDWHYLFGYATVLLVVLHLVFNLPLVWRYFTRPAGGATPAQSDVSRSALQARRGWLVALGLLVASAGSFVLGLRHGRSELRLSWPGYASDPAALGSSGAAGSGQAPVAAMGGAASDAHAQAVALVERYHAFSSHTRVGLVLRAPSVDWGDAPPPFKRYPSAMRLNFAAPAGTPPPPWGLQALGVLLWHTVGVSDRSTSLKLRTAPSSGGLFSTELYLLVGAMPGVPSGVWHYDPDAHALDRVAATLPSAEQWGTPQESALHSAGVTLVATAVFRRTGHKYRDRCYRYVLADLGHALENLRLAGDALGVAPRFALQFDEAKLAALLGVDEGDEGVLAVISLAPPQALTPLPTPTASPSARPGTAATATPRSAHAPPPSWRMPPQPLESALALGVTSAIHLATSLRLVDAKAAQAGPAPLVLDLHRPKPTSTNWLPIIAKRRSVRRFAATPIASDALAAVLADLAGPGPVLSGAVRVYVVVRAVQGMPVGAYRYDSASARLVAQRPSEDLSATAQAAALDQEVIGNAAAVLVLTMDRSAFATDPSGPARGYRHAFIEAGMVGERVYLHAAAAGLGACAVGAFYDQEAANLVALGTRREWVLHFAAIGTPA